MAPLGVVKSQNKSGHPAPRPSQGPSFTPYGQGPGGAFRPAPHCRLNLALMTSHTNLLLETSSISLGNQQRRLPYLPRRDMWTSRERVMLVRNIAH